MASSVNDNDEMITGINVTPLVDVVLVLLIIFMITAPAIYQAGIKVELPKAASGEKVERVTLRFSLMPNGEIRLGSDPVQLARVPSIVEDALKKDPQATAVVAADRNLAHGTVIELIDSLKSSGLTKIALGVQSKDNSRK